MKLTQSPFTHSRFLHPMMQRIVVAAGGGTLTTLSLQASATSTTHQVTGPASIAAGDLLVLWDTAASFGVPTTVLVPGFTSIANVNDAAFARNIASYKIADGSEAGATLTCMNGNLQDGKDLYVFRGNQAIAAVSVQDVASEVTDGNPTAQTVNASTGTPPLIVFGCYASGSAISPRTFNPAKDGEINSSNFDYLAYKIYNSLPANVSVDMDDEGNSNCIISFYLECS